MTKAKVTVTMDKDLLGKVKRAVAEKRSPSVSAYIEQAVRQWITEEAATGAFLKEMLDESGGPMTDEERAWADRVLG